jgi:hypothetical protein
MDKYEILGTEKLITGESSQIITPETESFDNLVSFEEFKQQFISKKDNPYTGVTEQELRVLYNTSIQSSRRDAEELIETWEDKECDGSYVDQVLGVPPNRAKIGR